MTRIECDWCGLDLTAQAKAKVSINYDMAMGQPVVTHFVPVGFSWDLCMPCKAVFMDKMKAK